MLQNIRDHLTGWVAAIPLLLIALAFAFWGVDMPFSGQTYAAKVNGEEIPLSDFRRAYQNQLNQFRQYYTDQLPPAIEDSIRQNVLQEFIRRELVNQRIRSAGYRIGDDALLESIYEMSVFQVGGEFSSESYRAQLSLQGLSRAGFEEDQRRELAANQLSSAIMQSSFVTDAEVRRFLELDGEQREVASVILDVNAYLDAVAVKEAEIIEQYESNRDQYRTEEKVTVQYIEVRLDDVALEVAVSDADVRGYYDEVSERYMTVERRRARHILVAVDSRTDAQMAEAKATELLQRLDAGEEFSGLAAEASDDPDTRDVGGDLDFLDQELMTDVLGSVIADIVFTMEPGSYAGPLRSEFGYHLLQLDEVQAEETQDYESVRAELESEFRKLQAEELFYDRAEQTETLAFEAWDELDSVSAELNLPLRQIPGFSRLGAGPFIGNSEVIEIVFGEEVLENGQNSRLVQLTDDHVAVFRVSDHQASMAKPLDDVRLEIRTRLMRDKAARHVIDLGDDAVTRIKQGENRDEVLAESGFVMPSPRWVSRSDAAIATDLLSSIFRTPLPETDESIVTGVGLADGNYAIYALTGGRLADVDSVSVAQYRSQSAQRRQQQAMGELSAYVGQLEVGADVTIGNIGPSQP